MKNLLVALWLVLLISAVGALFWYNDYQYSLPTPVPPHYKAVNNSTYITLPPELKLKSGQPVLIHFFNPDCPCSRFNLKHVKAIIKQYSSQAGFVVVLVTDKNYTTGEIQEKYKLNVPVIKNAILATACGVYSTPQAAILTADRHLYYRGNYNSSRYCTSTKTEYARNALDALLHNLPTVANTAATKAYGCRLAQNLNF